MIQVGDTVKIINRGKLYTTYDDFFEEHQPNLLEKYDERFYPPSGFIGTVIFIESHKWANEGLLCIVENKNKDIVLISTDGVRKIDWERIADLKKRLFKSKSREESEVVFEDATDEEIKEMLLSVVSMEQVNNALFGHPMNTEMTR